MALSKSLITKNLLVYGTTHAIVDATCIAVIFSSIKLNHIEPDYALFLVVLYNILAFGLQAPIGLLFDKLRKPTLAAIIGCIITAVSAVIFKFSLTAIIFAGVGNALFHIGGGIVSLNMNDSKAAVPGIYVAPGALGLLVGGIVAKGGYYTALPFVVLLILASVFIYFTECPQIRGYKQTKTTYSHFELIIILLLVSISIRSLIGLTISFPWKSDMNLLITLTLAVVFGKALGGIIADKFGWIKTTLTGLFVAAPLLAFGKDYPALAISGMFFFNLTMPVTLVAIANMFKGKAGFGFGLTTLALVIGALPTFTELKFIFDDMWTIFITILASVCILYIGLSLYFNGNQQNKEAKDLAFLNSENLKY